MPDIDKTTTQMKKGILEYLILSIISHWDAYSSDIIQQLKQANMIVVEWTMYPLLSRLKTEWLLEYVRVESVQWPPRKYFRLTEQWKSSLATMDEVRNNLVQTVNQITK